MSEDEILDNSTLSTKKSRYRKLILWWEHKRLYYNAILFITLVLILIEHVILGGKIEMIKDLGYGLYFLFGANIFYTLGWLVGIPFVNNDRKGHPNTVGRWILLVLGTLFSIFWIGDIYTTALKFG